MGNCNWELFEFRVIISVVGGQFSLIDVALGNISTEHVPIWNVSPILTEFGIGGFQGGNEHCNFKTVFEQLAKVPTISFLFTKETVENVNNLYGYSTLAAFYSNSRTLPRARLYVHRKDQSNLASLVTGVAIEMKDVSVVSIEKSNAYYVYLGGQRARVING